jgi:hypothetical protein
MQHVTTFHVRAVVTQTLLALVVLFVSIPHRLHACTESASAVCSCCCSHDGSSGLPCCADEQPAPTMPDMAAAEATDCCFTVYVDASTPSLPARLGSEPIPAMATTVIERLAAPSVTADFFAAASTPLRLNGARPHQVLCQWLI